MLNLHTLLVISASMLMLQTACTKSEEVNPTNISPADSTNKTAIQKLYTEEYIASILTDIGWTGNAANCTTGNTPTATQNKVLQRVNFYRKLVGFPGNVVLNNTKSQKCMQAALISKANNSLSHAPPASWSCYTIDGREASGKSNLSLGSAGSRAIDAYIKDAGSGNYFVGHRRWVLYPKLTEIGTGDTDRSNALWVIGNFGSVPDNMPEFIAYPPKGFMPQDLVYDRWSFSIPAADFSNATVTMTDAAGKTINVNTEQLKNGFGDRTIVWVPEEINTQSANDITYKVNISGVKLSTGETKDFSYEVTLFKAQ